MVPLLKQLGGTLLGSMGSGNRTAFIVKSLRTTYVMGGGLVAAVWYSAYRNERVEKGSGKFPFPGLANLKRRFPADRPEQELDRPQPTAGVAAHTTGSGERGVSPMTHGTANGQALLKRHPEIKPGVAKVAETIMQKFPGLSITSTTGGTHVSGSYHYKGRAVDLAGPVHEMKVAAAWISQNLYTLLAEGIHNPGLSVSDGQHVNKSFYAAVWAEHANHIHVAV